MGTLKRLSDILSCISEKPQIILCYEELVDRLSKSSQHYEVNNAEINVITHLSQDFDPDEFNSDVICELEENYEGLQSQELYEGVGSYTYLIIGEGYMMGILYEEDGSDAQLKLIRLNS